jgi:hypothetical protein
LSFWLSDDEYQGLGLLPHAEMADLAVELDIMPDAEIKPRELMSNLVVRLLVLAEAEGLPFSKWDTEDLSELHLEHRDALATAMGWKSDVNLMIKKGQKIYKFYKKERSNSQIAIMLPLLLRPLARHAYEKGTQRIG